MARMGKTWITGAVWAAMAVITPLAYTASALPAFAAGVICASCGKEIGPGRYMQDQWKACFHMQHSNLKRCYYCARGISAYNTRGGITYADGRDVCNICSGTSVTEDFEASSHAEQVRNRMGIWGLKFAYGTIPVRLVDQHTLDKLFGHRGGSHDGKINGLTTKKWTKDSTGRVISREVSIAMLYGLPLEVYQKTIAHELMHAWMFVDQQPEHQPALEEGVCNLAAYYILQENSTEYAQFLREAMYKSPNRVYGEGLRRAIRYVQRHEFAGLVGMLRANKDYPRGY